VGIIGRNGAGKSTLLKILSRITSPTRGRVDIYGRVGSLLEVGTGFHPELTGRENIYLNGAILGMTKEEVRRKFDEILAFAEVEKFIDTPVKRYSSGMYVRLAFAVAAHLEPEILLVDEVLAVGDAEFQKKCLGKMGDVAKQGRTVLFVSHNMAAMRRLCSRCIYLNKGYIAFDGNTEKTIGIYLDTSNNRLYAQFDPLPESPIRLRRIEIRDVHGNPIFGDVETEDGFCIRVTYDINRPIRGVHAFLRIHLADGETLLSTGDADNSAERLSLRSPGSYIADVSIPARLLGEGQYTVTWSAGVPFQVNYDVEFHALSFHVTDLSTKRTEHIYQRRPGFLGLDLNWNYINLNSK
jgi:lipopolysaccharide transport system ATP-binding protein